MKVYLVYQEFVRDVQRKNSKTLSAKKGELRFHKGYATKLGAERELEALAKSDGFVYKIKEVEVN